MSTECYENDTVYVCKSWPLCESNRDYSQSCMHFIHWSMPPLFIRVSCVIFGYFMLYSQVRMVLCHFTAEVAISCTFCLLKCILRWMIAEAMLAQFTDTYMRHYRGRWLSSFCTAFHYVTFIEWAESSTNVLLTHCGLITSYGDIDLAPFWLNKWHVSWRYQAITWTNVDFSLILW